MEEGTYNGWKNYETWAVSMYLDGNYDGEGTYREVLDSIEQIRRDEEPETLRVTVADFLRQYVEQWAVAEQELGASLAADLLGAALSSVDWMELAENKLSELVES